MGGSESGEHSGRVASRISMGGSARDFDALREAYRPLLAFDAAEPEERARFAYDCDFHGFGGVAISDIAGSAWSCARDERTIARRGDDSICVVRFMSGRHDCDADGRQAQPAPGDLFITSTVRPLAMRSTAWRKRTIMVPRSLVDPHLRHAEDAHGLVLRQGAPLHGLIAGHMRDFKEQAPHLSRAEALAVARATAALIAAGIEAASGARGLVPPETDIARLSMVRRVIDKHLADPLLSPDFVAVRCGLSRSALYRLAEPLGGIGRHIRERRLARAYAQIADPLAPPQRIGQIAQRWGFADAAAFSRAFQTRFGLTPSEARERQLGASPPPASEPGSPLGAFAHLLRGQAA